MPSTVSIGNVSNCQICGHAPLETVISLGHQPPVHAHLTPAKLHEPEVTYPLNLCRCSECGLLQLDYIVDPKVVFPPEYPYQTGMTNMLIRNFRALAEQVIPSYGLKPGDLVVDVGSNDGTLLQGFKEKGMAVLGIEPTDVARIANANGIETIQAYVTPDIAKDASAKHGKASIVTLTNVFAHIHNVYELVESIKALLADDGVFISESQYLMDIVETLEFDTIYHEHLRFYSLKPLMTLFSKTGMSLVDAERISAAGGSIRVYAKIGDHTASDRVKQLIAEEEKMGLYDSSALQAFADRVVKVKYDLIALLLKCKQDGSRIVGIGAPGRSNTLLGYTHIDSTILDYNCEKAGSPKIGLLTPGTHIPIVDERKLLEEQPPYALVNSWHIGDELVKKLKDLGYKGKCIIPLPVPRIAE